MKQTERLMEELRKRPMTNMEIWQDLAIWNGRGRIHDCRKLFAKEGKEIKTDMITVHNRFGEPCRVARYRLIDTFRLTA